MTTPKSLNKHRLHRGWSYQELADAIYDATHIRINARTLARFIDGLHEASETTQNAIDRFMAAQKPAQEASSR